MKNEFINLQNKQIKLAEEMIKNANGDEKVVGFANQLIECCKKSITIEQKMNNIG